MFISSASEGKLRDEFGKRDFRHVLIDGMCIVGDRTEVRTNHVVEKSNALTNSVKQKSPNFPAPMIYVCTDTGEIRGICPP